MRLYKSLGTQPSFRYVVVKGINLHIDLCYRHILTCVHKWLNLFVSLVLACLGFLSPANRGALMTCAVVLWVLLGTPAGYVSARMYKSKYMHLFNVTQSVKFRIVGLIIYLQLELVSQTLYLLHAAILQNSWKKSWHWNCFYFFSSAFRGEKWKTNVLLTALLCPGLVLFPLILSFILKYKRIRSGMELGKSQLLRCLSVWLCIWSPKVLFLLCIAYLWL